MPPLAPDAARPIGSPDKRTLTVDDFGHFERRYRVAHRFPALERSHRSAAAIAEGRVDEQRLAAGWQLVGSDLCVHRTYESHARDDAPAHLSLVQLLEGEAAITLGERTHRLTAERGVLLAYTGTGRLSACHVAQPRVRAVNLTLPASALTTDPRLARLRPLLETPGGCWPVTASDGLRASLSHWLARPDVAGGALLAEGLALQLLAEAMTAVTPEDSPSPCAFGDRLAGVHRLIQERPGDAHTLASLARIACMSASSLRSKYRQRYGRPLFDHLRECRLTLAHRLLREGGEVQEVAFRVGYRHPSNFATAFRRYHGVAPRDIAATARVPSALT
ncbi:helix-turn-helix transcriptional regulator [Salinicola halophilus]|uniref:helix-turn-helix transcriptional regulator n=1 Tax=Salinicola halophilus TaxID=184065 RepID=UPI001EF7EF5C|nr:helix-turn-helix transcriptional regulator [Salinicola halophilus]